MWWAVEHDAVLQGGYQDLALPAQGDASAVHLAVMVCTQKNQVGQFVCAAVDPFTDVVNFAPTRRARAVREPTTPVSDCHRFTVTNRD